MYEQRWGDAPVHTIAAALFAGKEGMHFFREIGYEHYPFIHCPQNEMWELGRCSCEQERNFGTSRRRTRSSLSVRVVRAASLMFVCFLDYAEGWSCTPRWERVTNNRLEL